MKTAAILLAMAVSGSDAPPPAPTYSQDEMKLAIAQAVQFGRHLGIAEAEAALEEARKVLDRCAIARPIQNLPAKKPPRGLL